MGGGSGGSGSGGRKGGGGGGATLAQKIEGSISVVKENIASGKLKKSDAIEAVRIMTDRANQADARGDTRAAKILDIRIDSLTKGANIKGDLYSKGILQARGRPIGSIGKGFR
jgi:hypothetical protein